MSDPRDYEIKVQSTPHQSEKSGAEIRAEVIAGWLDKRLGVRFWSLVVLIISGLIFGSPHLLIQYHCYGRCSQNAAEFNCQYLGIGGWKVADPERDKCLRFRLM